MTGVQTCALPISQRFGQTHRLSEARWLGEPRAESAALGKLTPRERQVLAHLIDGLSNKAIAQALSIGEGTVKVHLKAVLRKLDVANRTQAATLALKLGWSRAGAASP